MSDDDFRMILSLFGLSWAGYRKVRKGVKKRLVRHMKTVGCSRVEDYLSVLLDAPDICAETERLLTVSISRFFRDKILWHDLETRVFPVVPAGVQDSVRAWCAGCACGEEAYSLAMAWDCFAEMRGPVPELRIWATDMNPAVLERAREGIYGTGSLREVDDSLRERYFTALPKSNRFRIADRLQSCITWQLHNLLIEEPPALDFHIVLVRNSVLTYYADPLRKNALERITGSLLCGGFLIIGAHEKISDGFENLEPSGYNRLIFRKNCETCPHTVCQLKE